MAFLQFQNVRVAALACAAPEFKQEIRIDPASPRARYTRSYIKNIGVRQRQISITEQTSTDLGFAAAKRALEHAGWEAQSLDGLIFLSQMPDFNPGTGNAFILHKHLAMSEDAMAFDITLGCSSVPYGLSVCASYLQQPQINRLALIAGDNVWSGTLSKEEILEEETFLFGECTAAMLLENGSGEIDMALHSKGAGYKFLYNPCVGFRNAWRRGSPKVRLPNGEEFWWHAGQGNIMEGVEITSFSTSTVVDSIQNFLRKIKRDINSFDGLVLHQANAQIVNSIARHLNADPAKVPISLDRYGNTSGASALVTIADAYCATAKKELDLLVCSFGIGLSWGMFTIRIKSSAIMPIFSYGGVFTDDFIEPLTC